MKTKAKKQIYTLGAVIMAVVVFLFSLFFTGNEVANDLPKEEESFVNQSSSQVFEDSSDIVWDSSSEDSSISSSEETAVDSSKDSSEDSSSDGGGGNENGDGGSGGGGGPKILFTVLTDKTQTMYLRQDSKGNYTGNGEHGFVGDTKYYLEDPTDVNPLYFLGLAAKNGGNEIYQAEIELINITNDLLPYATIDKTGGINERTYTVNYSPYHYFANGTLGLQSLKINNLYSAQEARYYQFVQETYLEIPYELEQTLLALAAENGIYANSDTVISDVVNYVQNAAYYDYYYATRNYPSDKDMVTYFLTEHRRGVCRHFAAAATMMFRALGIPARYTIGFAVDVQANVKLEYSGAGHAWTEIYLEGYGWIPLEVTGGNIYMGE